MFKVYIIKNTHYEYESSDEKYGSWYSEETFQVDRVTTKQPVLESYESFQYDSSPDIKYFYILKMTYSYGDSFGSGISDELILASPYKDYLEHVKEYIDKAGPYEHFIIPAYPKYNYDQFHMSNPATDYFSHILDLDIKEFELVDY